MGCDKASVTAFDSLNVQLIPPAFMHTVLRMMRAGLQSMHLPATAGGMALPHASLWHARRVASSWAGSAHTHFSMAASTQTCRRSRPLSGLVHASTQPVDRATHNQKQAAEFGNPEVLKYFTAEQPHDIQQRLKSIIAAIPSLGEASRVIDVGSGTGCLIPHLQARGVQDILAVDVTPAMLEHIKAQYSQDGVLGNQLGVRTWQGDVVDLPNYLGWAADAFIFNAVFGNMHDPGAALLKASLQLKPGGYIVISHPMGRSWHSSLVKEQPDITPHALPDRPALDSLIQGLPLQVVEFKDESDLYCAVLQVPPLYRFPGAPVYMKAKVVTGFGRGSRQLGTPTANLDPVPLADTLTTLRRGVYYGWARLAAKPGDGYREEDLAVHKMVMNVGKRPTVNTGNEDPTVEVHIFHAFPQDFYGQEVKVVALGFVRPEIKFTGGLPELLNRIKLDIAIGRNQLDLQENKPYEQDTFLN